MAEKKAKTVIVDGVHNYSAAEAYIQPEPHIRQQLEGFKDLKLAFMVHWVAWVMRSLVSRRSPKWNF